MGDDVGPKGPAPAPPTCWMSLGFPKAVLKSSGTAWVLDQLLKGMMTRCREMQQGGKVMGRGCKPEEQGAW